jgi:hypothetical protein
LGQIIKKQKQRKQDKRKHKQNKQKQSKAMQNKKTSLILFNIYIYIIPLVVPGFCGPCVGFVCTGAIVVC